jgi:hypothetical protein
MRVNTMAKTKKRRGKAKPKIIANMGLFWHRNKVLWSRSKRVSKGLLGLRAGAKRSGEVDFWRQGGIYALYTDYHLVYVGQAGLSDKSCIGSRLKRHTRDDLADRWDMFSWFGLRKVRKNLKLGAKFNKAKATWSDVADVLEGILIEVAEPPQNSQKGRFGPGVHCYSQKPHDPPKDNLPLTIKQMAKDIAGIKKRLVKKKGIRGSQY